MSNKKSLREVFEFFPGAKWITQDKGRSGVISIHMSKPEKTRTWSEYDHWSSDIDNEINIDRCILQIDWQHRKTWKKRCVSRSEIIEGEG